MVTYAVIVIVLICVHRARSERDGLSSSSSSVVVVSPSAQPQPAVVTEEVAHVQPTTTCAADLPSNGAQAIESEN